MGKHQDVSYMVQVPVWDESYKNQEFVCLNIPHHAKPLWQWILNISKPPSAAVTFLACKNTINMKNLDQNAASSIRTYSTNTSSEKFDYSAWNTNSNFLLYLIRYLLCLDIKLKNNMKNKIAIIIAAALFKCARYLMKKKNRNV